ncbi:MAG: class I SAM-dependent methyltransferase [Myxococcales bacterium FL481]|nr:MAG: class I SAM-dependent methyltransferase [Myxococcales bacterium FL481]
MALAPRLQWSPASAVRLDDSQVQVRDRVRQRLQNGTYPTESVPCICGDDGENVIAERDRYGLPVRTLLCLRCGLLRTSPRMTAEATARFYEEDYRGLYTSAGQTAAQLFEHQTRTGRAFYQRFRKLTDRVDKVFEVGCGAGGFLLPFAEAGKVVAGVDLGSDYLEEGRRHGLNLVHGDAEALLERCGPADVVFALHVVEHFLDVPAELDRLRRLLTPGGILVIEVPGVRAIETAYRGDTLLYLQNAHTYHFTATTLQYTLNRCGFDVHYCDESALAVCTASAANRREVPPPANEAQETMRYLAGLERNWLAAQAG